MADPAPALSLTPPWPWAILHGGKTIENRDWRGCSFRGSLWLHAAKGIGSAYDFDSAVDAVAEAIATGPLSRASLAEATNRLVTAGQCLHPIRGGRRDGIKLPGPGLARGAIVGRARVVGVVTSPTPSSLFLDAADGVVIVDGQAPRRLTEGERRWWMGGFALVLADVVALASPVSCKGALGFWRVPEDVEAECLAQLLGTP